MLYIDLDDLGNRVFSNEFTWFNVGMIHKLERFCDLMSDYYRDPSLFEKLVRYSNRIGHSAISDMVFSCLYPEHYPEDTNPRDQSAIDVLYYYGIYNGLLFDSNINWPYNLYSPDFPPNHAPIEMIGDKKKVYRFAGSPFCKLFDAFVGIGFLHFQGPESKRFIPYFLLPEEASGAEERLYFDYQSCQWLPA